MLFFILSIILYHVSSKIASLLQKYVNGREFLFGIEVTFYFGTDAQCAPLRCLHKFLYVGAAIGRPFESEVTFLSWKEHGVLPYGVRGYTFACV